MDAATRAAHDASLTSSALMVHYTHADDLPPEICADDYDELAGLCRKYMSEADCALVEHAYCFAAEKHASQRRRSGEPYINHPVEVAVILAELKMDSDVVCARRCCTIRWRTPRISLADVRDIFGDTIALLVDGVTKLTNIEVDSMDEKQALNLRKMFLAMSKDIRVIIVKLADRLHNMRTLAALREDRRRFKARETMDVVRAAGRPPGHELHQVGARGPLVLLSRARGPISASPAWWPRAARCVSAISRRPSRRSPTELKDAGLEGFQINGRSKHYWSIYQKMRRKGKEFSEIYDLVAMRVICHTVGDCYSALGAVHALWHPMPGRFKDYIANPKLNNYQSLHTTVIRPPPPPPARNPDPHVRDARAGRVRHRRALALQRARAAPRPPSPATSSAWTSRSTCSSTRSTGRRPTRSTTPRSSCTRSRSISTTKRSSFSPPRARS